MTPGILRGTLAAHFRAQYDPGSGNPAYVKGLSIDQWSMQSFMSEGTIINFGSFESALTLENDRLEGTFRNTHEL